MTKLFVGMPCGGQMYLETAVSVMSAVGFANQEGVPTAFASLTSSVPSQNQNKLIEMALTEGADAVMLVDSDMIFPPETFVRLLKHEVGVVGAPYRYRGPPYTVAMGVLDGAAPPEIGETGLYRARFVPSGMVLARRMVLEAMGYPWMEEVYGKSPDDLIGHDVNFCLKADKLGFPVWADFDLAREVFHIGTLKVGLVENR